MPKDSGTPPDSKPLRSFVQGVRDGIAPELLVADLRRCADADDTAWMTALVYELLRLRDDYEKRIRDARDSGLHVKELRDLRRQLEEQKALVQPAVEQALALVADGKTARNRWILLRTLAGLVGILMAAGGASAAVYFAFVAPQLLGALFGAGFAGFGASLGGIFGKQLREAERAAVAITNSASQAAKALAASVDPPGPSALVQQSKSPDEDEQA